MPYQRPQGFLGLQGPIGTKYCPGELFQSFRGLAVQAALRIAVEDVEDLHLQGPMMWALHNTKLTTSDRPCLWKFHPGRCYKSPGKRSWISNGRYIRAGKLILLLQATPAEVQAVASFGDEPACIIPSACAGTPWAGTQARPEPQSSSDAVPGLQRTCPQEWALAFLVRGALLVAKIWGSQNRETQARG